MSALLWYELWADDGLDPPYVLMLLCRRDGAELEILDPKTDRVVHRASTYDEARSWLLEDEYERVQGRRTVDQREGDEVSLVLGAEHDDALRARLFEVLRSLGATAVDGGSYALAGSQEIQTLEVILEGQVLRIEAETYVGLSIAGPIDLLTRVKQAL